MNGVFIVINIHKISFFQNKSEYKEIEFTLLFCPRYRTTLRFDFLHSCMVCTQTSFDTQNPEVSRFQLRTCINTKPNCIQK